MSRQPVPILVFVVGNEGTKTASEEKAKSAPVEIATSRLQISSFEERCEEFEERQQQLVKGRPSLQQAISHRSHRELRKGLPRDCRTGGVWA